MIVSYKWLQTYFEKELPKPERLADILTRGAFEVEGVEQRGDDLILDVDVLPNRAHDCLSHRGIAREIATLTSLALKEVKPIVLETPHPDGVSVAVDEQELCRRYIGKVVADVAIGPSPDWLRERLESIGQKSINNVVDATNFIMFDMGQPLHAFDLDKVTGEKIIVRKARAGERITTLDGKDTELDGSVLIIADENTPLAIAGVKGGTKAEITEGTTRIVLEAANFHPVSVRKTSRRLGILTDSSKRFENELSPELAAEAIERVALLIREISTGGHARIGESIDKYPRRPAQYRVGITVNETNALLGTDLSENEILAVLKKLRIDVEKVDDPLAKVLALAPTLEGVPYVPVGTVIYDAPERFSCSSFTNYLFVQAGIAMPSISIDQYVFGIPVQESDLSPGDLVFSNTKEGAIRYESVHFLPGTKVPEGVDHVGLYLGDGNVIHATRHAGKVIVENLAESKSFAHVSGYRRITADHTPRLVATVPHERLDLRIKEDIIEEIGRVHGYPHIASTLPRMDFKPSVNANFYYANKIRGVLKDEGFSEVYLYSFTDKGVTKLANPLASDKSFLRTNLADGILAGLAFNERNADLLGLDSIKVFEFGNVFEGDGEHTSCALGIKHARKTKGKEKEELEAVIRVLSESLGADLKGVYREDAAGVVFETNFGELVAELPEPSSYEGMIPESTLNVAYRTISPYPCVLRDIAVWTPEGTKEDEVTALISGEAGELLVRPPKLFDRFEKPARAGEAAGGGRVSYAFNLVFQSREKTLTDDEVNTIMDAITDAMNTKGWEVR